MTTSRLALDRPHVFIPGSDPEGAVLLALHQTGGNEEGIAAFARSLDHNATVLAPRGSVTEGPHLRWFKRHSEGVFDVDDVLRQADNLASFVTSAMGAYGLQGRRLIPVGFSNGANIALALAVSHPSLLDGVIAFSGMYPFADREVDANLEQLPILLMNGEDDDMAPQESVTRLDQQLQKSGAQVIRRTRAGGHAITAEELDAARQWLRSRNTTDNI